MCLWVALSIDLKGTIADNVKDVDSRTNAIKSKCSVQVYKSMWTDQHHIPANISNRNGKTQGQASALHIT